ncbi:MAG TPA: SRPBCC family protein [Gaiellaceae bacterium]|nr:SRPBCC family protein [Gaiellaceae bacterium]
MRIARNVEIAAPPEAVFAVVSDLSTHTEWRPAVKEFRTADGEPAAVGSEIVEVVRFAGRDVNMRYRVTELEAPRVLTAEGIAGPLPAVIRFELEPTGIGTVTTFVFDTERPRLGGVLPFPFFGPLMGRYMVDELRRLKTLVETGAR